MKTVKISHFRTLSSELVGGFDQTGMQNYPVGKELSRLLYGIVKGMALEMERHLEDNYYQVYQEKCLPSVSDTKDNRSIRTSA